MHGPEYALIVCTQNQLDSPLRQRTGARNVRVRQDLSSDHGLNVDCDDAALRLLESAAILMAADRECIGKPRLQ